MKRITLYVCNKLPSAPGLVKRITLYVCNKLLSPPGLVKRISLDLNLLQTSASCRRQRNTITLGGLKGYSVEKLMSRKKTPPSYTEPVGPRMVEAHSYRLSPLGPALQAHTMTQYTQ